MFIVLTFVTIIGPPTRPEGPLKVKDVTSSGAKVKWDKPKDDGGKPITAYVVEKMDAQTGRWIPVGRTQEPEMDIKGLQEGHEYSFRVKALNEEGESEALESDGTIIAKNPYGKYKRQPKKNYRMVLIIFLPSIIHRKSW